jgi:GTPase
MINLKDKVILTGIVNEGSFYLGMQYNLGPDAEGNFKVVTIEGIHCKKVDVKSASKGQYCSILLDSAVSKDNVRKGMVLLDLNHKYVASRSFEAEVWSLDDTPTKVKYTSQPSMKISHIRQTVKMKKPEECTDDEFVLIPEQAIKMQFEFVYQPEYITEGSHLIILENSLKVYGYITKVNI